MRIGSERANVLYANQDAALALPEPGERFRLYADTPAVCHGSLRAFYRERIIERVDQQPAEPSGHPRGLYEVPREVHEWIQEHLADRRQLPGCPHGGFRKLRNGEGYTCGDPDCDQRYDRETIVRVFEIADRPRAATDGGGQEANR